MKLLYPFAKRFIAGPDLETALFAIRKIVQSGYFASIDILGENVSSRLQAQNATNEYLQLFTTLNELNHPFDISVKLSQLGLDLDQDICQKNLELLVNSSGPHTIRIDMEDSFHTQSTLEVCAAVHQNHPKLGQAIQAYLFRSEKDILRCIDEGISVRLCKGAYKEPSHIAIQSMDEVRKRYLKLVYPLLKDGHQTAIATHDENLLVEILKFIESEKIHSDSFYFEMLYGVRRDLQKILQRKGFRVRIYVPYGKAWLPYTLRRLSEKKENLYFVITHLFRETLGLQKLH
ncbi:MAG: proline dehydrogenase [Nitrospina sp.]|nr:proline dehydrogenase [Nitrospina sp.]